MLSVIQVKFKTKAWSGSWYTDFLTLSAYIRQVSYKSMNHKNVYFFDCFGHKTSSPLCCAGVTCRCCTSAWSTVWPTTPSWPNVSSARPLALLQRTRLSSTKWQWSPFRMESESQSNRRPQNTRLTIVKSHRIKELVLLVSNAAGKRERNVCLSLVGVLILGLSVAPAGRMQSAYSLTQWRRSKPLAAR